MRLTRRKLYRASILIVKIIPMAGKDELEILVLFFFLIEEFYAQAIVQQGFPNHFAHHAIPPFWRDKTSKKKNITPRYFPPESNT